MFPTKEYDPGLDRTYLVASNDQQSRIGGMENTRVEFIAVTAQLMNGFALIPGSKRPHSNRILANRCQELSRRIPTK